MNKHTPGPWQLARADANRCRVDIETVERGNDLPDQGNHIAVAYWGTPIEEANARLIAAAPQLLQALSRYGRHDDACPLHDEANLPNDPRCRCGFSAALGVGGES